MVKAHIQKMKIMASGPITSWEIEGETVETVSDFIFSVSIIFSLMLFMEEDFSTVFFN